MNRTQRSVVVSLAGALLFGAACAAVPRVAAAPQPVEPKQLVGTWTVDLRPRPDAPPSLKTLEVWSVEGTRFTGRFYDTELEDGRIEGLSHSLGRGFLSVWRATPQP